jgi:hypothetical protein
MFDATEPTPLDETGSPPIRATTPLEAVRAECIKCCNGSLTEVRKCPARSCALWSLRMGRRAADAPRSTVGAIREKCIDCSGGSLAEVRNCSHQSTCPLHPFRMGKNPNRRREAHHD